MTTTVRRDETTSHVPGHVDHTEHGVDVLDGCGAGRPRPTTSSHPLRRVWLFLISMRTGLWIILTLGVLTLLGTLLMQAEPEVRADAEAYQQWLAGTPTQRYGGWAGILDKLGLFHVFSTWYFMGLFALLSLSILACSVNRAPRLWRVATKPRTTMSEVFFSHAPLRATVDLPVDGATAAERVRTALRREHFRVRRDARRSTAPPSTPTASAGARSAPSWRTSASSWSCSASSSAPPPASRTRPSSPPSACRSASATAPAWSSRPSRSPTPTTTTAPPRTTSPTWP